MAKFFWDSEYVALSDKHELLVDNENEAPIWHHQIEDEIVGIARDGQEVITLDTGGHLRYWDLAQGTETQIYLVPNNPIAMSRVYEGRVAVITEREVLIFDHGHEAARQLLEGGVNAAFSGDGSLVAVALEDGTCAIYDATLDLINTSKVTETPGRDIVWNRNGHWQMAAGKGVYLVSVGGTDISCMSSKSTDIQAVTASPDGSKYAYLTGDHFIYVVATEKREFLARVRIEDRKITDLHLNNNQYVTLSLEGGDGNRVSVVERNKVWCNESHPGRPSVSWMVYIAFPDPPEPKSAPPEKPVSKPASLKTSAESESEEAKPSLLRRGCRMVMIIVFVISALLFILIMTGLWLQAPS